MVGERLKPNAAAHTGPHAEPQGSMQANQPEHKHANLTTKQIWQTRKTILLVFLCCAMPVALAAYFYYVAQPQTTTNYGTLLVPQVSVPNFVFQKMDGTTFNMKSLNGKWVWVQVVNGPCEEACQKGLYFQRQARLSKGKDQHRIERVVFIAHPGAWQGAWAEQYPGVHWVKSELPTLQQWLPLSSGKLGREKNDVVGELHQHLFVVDPLGNVMMRFPKLDALDFKSFRRDISRLLWASKVG